MEQVNAASGRVVVEPWAGNVAGATRTALVLPGANYPVELPGLFHAMRALALAGWRLQVARWDMSRATAEQAQAMVEQACRLQERDGVPELLLAKSIGTHGAGWAAEHRLPAVWTTPLLTVPRCVKALKDHTAPALLVAGTRDSAWDDRAAPATGLPTVRVDGMDHGWQCGDWRRELEACGRVAQAVSAFAATLPSAD